MLPSPAALHGFARELASASATLAGVASKVEATARGDDWSGPAADACAGVAGSLALAARRQAGGLAEDAARVDRLADGLAAELAALHRLEQSVLGCLAGFTRRALHDVDAAGAEAVRVYESVRHSLPPSGSPAWRDAAATLTRAGLM